MVKTYNVGIIGCGDIAVGAPQQRPVPPFQDEQFFSHTASLALIPRVQIVGFCDVLPEKLDRVKATWEMRWPDANLYTDYREMLQKEDLDILTVATPDTSHATMTIDGAQAGVKGIFCEKPMATSLEDADSMIAACDKAGTVLSVNHSRRWSPLYHRVKDEIRSGAIGTLGTIVGTLGGPRAMLFRNGGHVVDTIRFFAESEPIKVFARLEEGYDDWDRYKGVGGGSASEHTKNDSEPGASGFILFKNGVRAFYVGTKRTFEMFSFQLSGPNGQIYITDRSASRTTGDRAIGEGMSQPLLPKDYQVQGLSAAYEELIDNIEGGGTGMSSGKDARETLRIIFSFLDSHQDGSSMVNFSEQVD